MLLSRACRAGGPLGGLPYSVPVLSSASQYVLCNKQQRRSVFEVAGTGGRSSVSGIVATVFGATGFVGRYVVNRLGQVGSQLAIPHRGEDRWVKHLKVMGDLGQIVPITCDMLDPEQLEEAIGRTDIVVNLLGCRWATRNYSLDDSNHKIPKLIAEVAKKCGTEHFIHVSALGAAPDARSEWARAKYAGEEAIREILPEATILRPSTMFGFEDRLLNRWAGITRFWPATPDFKSFNNRLEGPLCVSDFATAVLRVIQHPERSKGRVYELEGPVLSLGELIHHIEEVLLVEKRKIPVSMYTAKNIARFLGLLRNPRFTEDEIVSMMEDNLAGISGEEDILTIQDLGIEPKDIRDGTIKYIRHYRRPNFINLVEY